MSGRILPQPAAFTLVELLIGATLSAAIMAAVLSSYIYLGRGLARLANQQKLENEARIALATFNDDVRSAIGVSGTPNALFVTLKMPASSGITEIYYLYNRTGTSNSPNPVVGTLTRRVTTSSGVTSRVLLRNITDGDGGTTFDLYFRYYDAAGNAFDNAPSSYSVTTSHPTSIKRLSLAFALRIGLAANGTQTPVNWIRSGPTNFRNPTLLQ